MGRDGKTCVRVHNQGSITSFSFVLPSALLKGTQNNAFFFCLCVNWLSHFINIFNDRRDENMNKAKYANKIREGDKLGTVPQAMDYFKLSRGLLLKIASDNGCVVRIGRTVRINVPKLSEAIDKLY